MKKLRSNPVFYSWLAFALTVNLPLWLVDIHAVQIKWCFLWMAVIVGLSFVIETLLQVERMEREGSDA